MIGGVCSEDCQSLPLRSIFEFVPETETFIRRSEKLDVAVSDFAAVMTGNCTTKHFTIDCCQIWLLGPGFWLLWRLYHSKQMITKNNELFYVTQ